MDLAHIIDDLSSKWARPINSIKICTYMLAEKPVIAKIEKTNKTELRRESRQTQPKQPSSYLAPQRRHYTYNNVAEALIISKKKKNYFFRA